jgi:hypothetical protein
MSHTRKSVQIKAASGKKVANRESGGVCGPEVMAFMEQCVEQGLRISYGFLLEVGQHYGFFSEGQQVRSVTPKNCLPTKFWHLVCRESAKKGEEDSVGHGFYHKKALRQFPEGALESLGDAAKAEPMNDADVYFGWLKDWNAANDDDAAE